MEPVVSLCASANRVIWWPRFLDSLKGNKVPYEVIFVGDTRPPQETLDKYPELKYIYSTTKPAQCYEIAFRAAKGKFIHWTADDADYHVFKQVLPVHGPDCFDPLDRAVKAWEDLDAKNGNDGKTVIAFRPIEDGGDVYKFHHFFGGWDHTPIMAPFCLIGRDYFVNHLGGYDNRFVSGQSENDVVMRVLEDGGRVEVALDSFLYVHHRQVHPRTPDGTKEDNKFRKWYNTDRDALEMFWVVGGRGWYEKINAMRPGPEKTAEEKKVPISPKRLYPVERFEDTGILTETQGWKGHWV